MSRPVEQTDLPSAVIAAAFAQALDQAALHEGATAPNPAVGCVLLDASGAVIAAAGHTRAGAPHAEAAALDLARASGRLTDLHTAIVTLEPCNHQGRTGPCAGALAQTPVSRLWYALPDPNPTASGGAERLRQVGIATFTLADLNHPDRDQLLARARRLLAPFACRITRGRPFLTVKQALDASGRMIPPPGQKTFTGPAALDLAHALRRRADAILTGSGTILADRPLLTVRRLPDIPGKTRDLVILDRRGRVDAAYLAEAATRGLRPWIARDLGEALSHLAANGCNEVLIEAGPTLCHALEQAGLWDEWVRITQGPQGHDHITITRNPRTETP